MKSLDQTPAGSTSDTAPEQAVASLVIGSQVGELVALASGRGLCGLYFGHRIDRVSLPGGGSGNELLGEVEAQFDEYFSGRRTAFDLPLDAAGTPFQLAVWERLSAIPFGQTRSYRDIAVELGKPGASRAVGLANGANPISVVVPCHRVIGADGSLTGFGGGLAIKQRLLEHEGVLLAVA